MSPGSGCGGTVFHRPGTKRMGPFSAVRGYTTKLTGMSSEAHPHDERLPEVRARVARRTLKQRSSHSSESALASYAQPPEVAAQSASLLKTEEGLTDTMVRLPGVPRRRGMATTGSKGSLLVTFVPPRAAPPPPPRPRPSSSHGTSAA